MWNRDHRVTGLWTNNSNRNAWVHLSGLGWRKITNTSDVAQITMLTQLTSAKAANRRVDSLQENNTIRQLYVI
jgi:hypothetical protein